MTPPDNLTRMVNGRVSEGQYSVLVYVAELNHCGLSEALRLIIDGYADHLQESDENVSLVRKMSTTGHDRAE